MKTLDVRTEEIREQWFVKHKATVTELDGVTILDWRNPDTFMYALKYVMVDNKLYISGDLGNAVYDLTWSATLNSFHDVNLSYFTGKLSCSSRDKYNFSEELAITQIKEHFIEWCDVDEISEMDEKELDLYEQLIAEAAEWDNHNQFSLMGVWSIYNDSNIEWFDSESASIIADCGRELSGSVIAYWLGLKMAVEHIRDVDELKVSAKE